MISMKAAVPGHRTESTVSPNHICGFYDSREVRDDLLVAFLRDGLAQGDKCVCFMQDETELIARVLEPGNDTPMHPACQLEFRNADRAYLDNGMFSKDVMIERLEEEVRSALRDGYPVTRLIGDMSWVIRNRVDPKLVVAYEMQANDFARRFPQIALCLYDLAEFDGSIVLDLMRTHPKIIMNGLVVENPYFVPEPHIGKR
jgi:hypothetical protein